ncbi:MAG: N-6 DNA methylase [Burkholderiaceae bacterium]|nr:N-6 DNA methylase [Burkholderiaceae bacterium]
MGPEELGSIYEALLELVPEIDTASQPWQFRFVGDDAPTAEGAVAGNARKLTGSYYTPDTLVQELIKSALEPVIADRLRHAKDSEKALLSIKVLDPACGSGHFLLAAARKLAENLAKVRAVEGEPRSDDYQRAIRDIVSHCIFGVDRNPLALELARTALWLESFSPGRPLGFLDHHFRCGDALIGVLDQRVMEDGIPEEAFKPLSGDDKVVCREISKKNVAARKELRREKERLAVMQELTVYEAEGGRLLDSMPEDSIEQVEAKREAFQQAYRATEESKARRLADCFVAAFFVPKTKDSFSSSPTTEDLHRVLRDVGARQGVAEAVEATSRAASAFHWYLEFADVFQQGGFDVLLGNPPWERIKLQEEEFFATRSPNIATARNKAERVRLIQRLANGTPLEQALYTSFEKAKRLAEAASLYAHDSGRYPLTGVGDVNTYALFAETFFRLVRKDGRAGLIVPSGIATDDSTKLFFSEISQQGSLVSLFAFENEEFIFPSVHHSFRFCLLVLGATDVSRPARFVFFARQPEQVHEVHRQFMLSAEDFRLINPNTRTCPVFRSRADADLTKKIYSGVPVLLREAEDGHREVNPWSIKFASMFHMSNDSNLFEIESSDGRLPLYEAKMMHQFDHRWATYDAGDEDARDTTQAERRDASFQVRPRYWVPAREVWLRAARLPVGLLNALRERNKPAIVLMTAHSLFSAALQRQGLTAQQLLLVLFREWKRFVDRHPFASVIAPTQLGLCGNNPPSLEPRGPAYLPAEPVDRVKRDGREKTAWYAIDAGAVTAFIDPTLSVGAPEPEASLASEDDALAFAETWLENATPKWFVGFRDVTSAHVLRTVIANVLPVAGFGNNLPLVLFGESVSPRLCAAFIGNLCSLVLDFVARHKVGGNHLNFFIAKQLPVLRPERYTERDLDFIVPRVLELTYTAHDLMAWAKDLSHEAQPFTFDTDRRALVQSELDAYYARLYGLTRDELRYILDPSDVMGADYPSETFRVLRNSEEKQFGEYRTGRLVLEAWDRIEQRQSAAPTLAPARPVGPKLDVLPMGAWARPMADERAESGAVLGAILKAMAGAMPARQVRLTATLALQPRLLRPFLTADEATTWRRLVGPEADVLPQGTSTVIPRVDGAWGAAVRTLRTNGSLVEETRRATWAPGANLDALETAGWPDGRARFVLAVVERQATESIVRELPAPLRDWIDAQAA